MFKFWSRWMGATVLGFIGGFVGIFLLIGLITGDEGPDAFGMSFEVFFPMWLGLAAALMGTLQWLVIRRRSEGLVGWIPATALGVLFGIALLVALVVVMGEPETIIATVLSGALHGIVVGAIVGTAQWFAIRDLDSSRRWIKVNVLALLMAGAIGDTIGFYTDGGTGTMVIFLLWQAAVAPTLYGLMTSRSAGEGVRPTPAHA